MGKRLRKADLRLVLLEGIPLLQLLLVLGHCLAGRLLPHDLVLIGHGSPHLTALHRHFLDTKIGMLRSYVLAPGGIHPQHEGAHGFFWGVLRSLTSLS